MGYVKPCYLGTVQILIYAWALAMCCVCHLWIIDSFTPRATSPSIMSISAIINQSMSSWPKFHGTELCMLTHCDQVMPYIAKEIWVNIGSGNGLFLKATSHHLHQCTNVDQSSGRSCDVLLGLALLTLSWDKNWDSHSLVNGYPSFYPRIALVAPSPEGNFTGNVQNI